MMRAASVFPSFDRLKSPLPGWAWDALRGATMLVTVALAAFLTFWPQAGLKFFWGLVIPVVPALLAIAPGLWRQICPMALVNQIPRRFNFSRGLDLPPFLRDNAFMFALIAFFGLVAMRRPIFNVNGPATAFMAVSALVFAFIGGLFFKGRAGWCGTFCPLGPIQRDYGHAPTVIVPNGHCPTCVGCQKNCYDFNPQAAFFDDLYDEDPRYANQRRFFLAMMPGMIFGYFAQLGSDVAYHWYVVNFVAATCASVGAFYLLVSFGRASYARASSLFAAGALALFYWFAAPIMASTLDYFLAAKPGAFALAIPVARAIGGAVALLLFVQGWRNERVYLEALAREEAKQAEARRARQIESYDVLDQGAGLVMPALPEQNLLTVMQTAGVPINATCRSGLCGADAVVILEGSDNLSPPTDDELATLRRLGLEGKARLACSCQVRGSVVMSRDLAQASATGCGASAAEAGLESGAAAELSPSRLELAIHRARRGGAPAAKSPSRALVVIGNGAAGVTLAQALRERDGERRIVMLSAEPTHFYNRMALGKVISGKMSAEALTMNPPSWYEERAIETRLASRVVAIDRAQRVATTLSGEAIAYDQLVLATGARARAPTPAFLAHANAFVLRAASDASAIRRYALERGAARAAVIGGGVQGVEAAEALRQMGLEVTLVHSHPQLMNRQLDEESADLLRRYLERTGVRVAAGSPIAAYEGARELRSLRLKSGERIEADIFVANAGTTPNDELARACGLAIGRGVRVDASMRTSDPAIFAIGDVADMGEGPSGLWPTALAQAKVAAAALCGEAAIYEPREPVMQLKSDGVDLLTYGDIHRLPEGAEMIAAPPFADAWWRMAVKDGQIAAAVYLGAVGAAGQFGRLLRAHADISDQLGDLRKGRFEALRKLKVA